MILFSLLLSITTVREWIFGLTCMREPWEGRFKLPIHDSSFSLPSYAHKAPQHFNAAE